MGARYRHYDITTTINRALGYGSFTLMLVVAYVGGGLVLE